MARPNVTAPIAGTSKPEQLGDLVKAATLKLSPAQIEALLNQVVEHPKTMPVILTTYEEGDV
jgi:aryl-alcohol dehydrogenase-like predicted oxidoreductase